MELPYRHISNYRNSSRICRNVSSSSGALPLGYGFLLVSSIKYFVTVSSLSDLSGGMHISGNSYVGHFLFLTFVYSLLLFWENA